MDSDDDLSSIDSAPDSRAIATALRNAVQRQFVEDPSKATIKNIRVRVENELNLGDDFLKQDSFWIAESRLIILDEADKQNTLELAALAETAEPATLQKEPTPEKQSPVKPAKKHFYQEYYPEALPVTLYEDAISSPIYHPSPPPPTPPAPEPQAVRSYYTPVSEPPAWRLNHKIGTGACGTVFLENVHIPGMKSPELWAVKRISRTLPNFTFKRYEAEINNLQMLARHEWFVKFNSTYKDTHYMYIAMEYMPMGDMSQSFTDGYRWNESDTRVVIKQLLHGLVVMHKEGITHRDLKPENIFLYLPENHTHILRVKIGDFGTSKRIPPSNASTYLKTTTGTQGYMAPEVHDTSQEKTNKVDIWSLGCILYRMFAGNLLFKDPFEVLRYSWTASSSPLALDGIGFSIPCVLFLRGILQPIPEDRPSAEDCQKKAWIMSEAPGSEYAIGTDLHTRLSNINHQVPNVHSFPK